MFSTKKIFLLSICFSFLSFFFVRDCSADSKRVLVIFSYHKGMTWVDTVSHGLEQRFQTAMGDDIQLHFEYLDSKRYSGKDHENLFKQTLANKYNAAKLDCIVVCDDNALNILLEVRENVFPQVPIVFCGINFYSPLRFRHINNITGIVEAYDARRTLQTALALHPETRKIYIVNDLTTTGKANRKRLDAILPDFSGIVEWEYLEGLKINDLQDRLGILEQNSLILLMSYNRDGDGRILRYRDAVRVVRESSDRPIYGVWGFYLGKGIVGGYLVTGESQGAAAADLTLQILSGKPVDSLGVITESPNELVFDFNELNRFDVEESDLPDNSRVINIPPTVLRTHKKSIFTGVAIVLLQLVIIVYLINNIKKRKRSEQTLQENRLKLSTTLDAIGEAVISTDEFGVINRTNPAALRLLDRTSDQLMGKPSKEFIRLKDAANGQSHGDPCIKCLEQNKLFEFPVNSALVLQDGNEIRVSGTCAPILGSHNEIIGTVLVCRDITEKINLHSMLAQSQKMEAIGQLAGGVAHDFNNMLAGIIGFSQLLRSKLKDDKKLKEAADYILETSRNATELISKLLSFARKGKVISSVMNCHETILSSIALLERSLDKKIEIKRDLKADNAVVLGDPTQLQNVFLNLGINGGDAMIDGGILSFTTKNETLDVPYMCESGELLKKGDYLCISVQDTGSGIEEGIQKSIFDPFFTTKEKGKGTGLGLSAVIGAVNEHNGGLVLQSNPGEGTLFKIYLPVVTEKPEIAEKQERQIQIKNECILIIDDERIVIASYKQLLGSLGYKVLTALNGPDGISLYKEKQKEIDVVILDLNMPVMDGVTCMAKLQEINSEVRIILSSGYKQDYRIEELYAKGIKGFLPKPNTEQDVCKAINEAMDNTHI